MWLQHWQCRDVHVFLFLCDKQFSVIYSHLAASLILQYFHSKKYIMQPKYLSSNHLTISFHSSTPTPTRSSRGSRRSCHSASPRITARTSPAAWLSCSCTSAWRRRSRPTMGTSRLSMPKARSSSSRAYPH